jgi:hypothetical protein
MVSDDGIMLFCVSVSLFKTGIVTVSSSVTVALSSRALGVSFDTTIDMVAVAQASCVSQMVY